MTQQKSFRFVNEFVEVAIAAIVFTGFAWLTNLDSGQAIAIEIENKPTVSEQPLNTQAANLGEPMQAECIAVTLLLSRPDCAVGGEVFLYPSSETTEAEMVIRVNLEAAKPDQTNRATLWRTSF
jgi:hypothetical protein